MKKIKIKNFKIGEKEPLCIITGPCVIESEDHALFSAKILKEIFDSENINFIFKASYDKANRSSVHSFRGPGIEEGLKILEKVKKEFDIPILTDIHLPPHAEMAAEVCDIIQIPAFLCRQTDLIKAAAKTKAAINIKKGQFINPLSMKNTVEKALFFNNKNILLTERGTFFGYNHLINDFTAIYTMKKFGFPVGFDATHSVQRPSSKSVTQGEKEFIPTLINAAIATGANFIYLESHKTPEKAKSDPFTVISFDKLKKLLPRIKKLYNFIQNIDA